MLISNEICQGIWVILLTYNAVVCKKKKKEKKKEKEKSLKLLKIAF